MKAKKKIFIIDDEKDYAAMVKINLERTNLFHVETESNPRKAIRSLLRFKPDLIILDIIMRDISGLTLAKDLRNRPELKDIPICFLSVSSKSSHDFREGKTAMHLQKPVTTDQLVSAIQKQLGENL